MNKQMVKGFMNSVKEEEAEITETGKDESNEAWGNRRETENSKEERRGKEEIKVGGNWMCESEENKVTLV